MHNLSIELQGVAQVKKDSWVSHCRFEFLETDYNTLH